MIKSFLITIILLTSACSFSQNFEGKLIYKVTLGGTFQVLDSLYDFKKLIETKGDYFDTTKFFIKDSVSKQETTKRYGLKKQITNYQKKKTYSISTSHINVEDYSNSSISNSTDPKFGKYISHELRDTVFLVNSNLVKATILAVQNKYAQEKYVFSHSLPRFAFSKNILMEPNYLSYHLLIDSIISNSILLIYEVSNLEMKNNSSFWRFELTDLKERVILQDEIKLPSYRETRKNRKQNSYLPHKKIYKIVKPILKKRTK